MSLFDKLKQAWKDAGAEATDKASRLAAETAARQAAKAATAALAAAGDELVGDMEKQLKEAEGARAGRPPVGLSTGRADEIAARIEAVAQEADQLRTSRAERQQRARDELARLKAARDEAAAAGAPPAASPAASATEPRTGED